MIGKNRKMCPGGVCALDFIYGSVHCKNCPVNIAYYVGCTDQSEMDKCRVSELEDNYIIGPNIARDVLTAIAAAEIKDGK